MPTRQAKLIVLDRDGVINYDSDQFIKSPDEWRPIPGSLEAIARLNHAGFRVIVATNQSGLGRRLFDMATLIAIHDKMYKMLAQLGPLLEAIGAKFQQLFVDARDGRFLRQKRFAKTDSGPIGEMFRPFSEKLSATK